MRTLLLSLMLFTPAIACSVPADSLIRTTDGGTWWVEIDAVEAPTGWAEVPLYVRDSDGAAVGGLTLVADVSMPSMGHGSTEPVSVEEVGEGDHLVTAFFQMPGEWLLDGSFQGDHGPEAFAFTLDVISD